MNISYKIILPAVSLILISWLDLNAKANKDKVQPQKLVKHSILTQCSKATTNARNHFTSPKSANCDYLA